MKLCAVIMAAHGTPRFVLDAIESVDRQDPLDGWRYELRVGVDGCPNTRKILERRSRGFWWCERSVGAYIMRNSLIEIAPAAAYAIFDSDDVMYPSYLRTLLPHTERGMIAGAGRVNTRVDLRPQDRAQYRSGICVIPHRRWRELGGYRPERIGSDVDLIDRAKAMSIDIHREWPALYLRRKRAGSLTQAPSTSIRSEFRARMRRLQIRDVRRGRLRVNNPRTTELEWIGGETAA